MDLGDIYRELLEAVDQDRFQGSWPPAEPREHGGSAGALLDAAIAALDHAIRDGGTMEEIGKLLGPVDENEVARDAARVVWGAQRILVMHGLRDAGYRETIEELSELHMGIMDTLPDEYR